MKYNTKTVDSMLKDAVPPEYDNKAQQASLRSQLMRTMSVETSKASIPSLSIFALLRGKLGLACLSTAAVCLLVLIGMSILSPASVWAKSVAAMKKIRSAVITIQHFPANQTGSAKAKEQIQLFLQVPDRFAVITPMEKVWLTNSEMFRYEPRSNQVSRAKVGKSPAGTPFDVISSGQFTYRLFALDYDQETDRGMAQFEGRNLRRIEVSDSHDPTEKSEFYLDAVSLLPVVQLTSRRDGSSEPWHPASRADFAFDGAIDRKVFIPDYPSTAEVIQINQAMAQPPVGSSKAANDWEKKALGIARHGDKYFAVTDAWVGEGGWIGLKFRTNVYMAMSVIAGFHDNAENQRHWKLDALTLYNYLSAGYVYGNDGLFYSAHNGYQVTHESSGDGSAAYSRFYSNDTTTTKPEIVFPKTITIRYLANVSDKGRGESEEHFWDWKNSPEKYQLIELTFRAPAPSANPPSGFNEGDIEWMKRIEIENEHWNTWLARMRDAGRDQEAYDRLRSEPEDIRLYLGARWLILLDNMGKDDEKRAFYTTYLQYAAHKWGDQAETPGNLKLCKEIVERKHKQRKAKH